MIKNRSLLKRSLPVDRCHHNRPATSPDLARFSLKSFSFHLLLSLLQLFAVSFPVPLPVSNSDLTGSYKKQFTL